MWNEKNKTFRPQIAHSYYKLTKKKESFKVKYINITIIHVTRNKPLSLKNIKLNLNATH
jgi:hypothetical protein